MTHPEWNPDNLRRHYRVHPCSPDEAACWCKVTGVRPGPISIEQYDEESKSVIERAWLVFDSGYQEFPDSDVDQVRSFYDRRSCFTTISTATARIRTCFHWHTEAGCDTSDTWVSKKNLLKRVISKKSSPRGRISAAKVVGQLTRLNVEERRSLRTYIEDLEGNKRTLRSS